MSTIKVNKIEKRSGSTLELGGPGTAVTLACGATQTGFGRTGTVDWCTTAKTSPFTATSGSGFFVDTSSGAITVTLPSSPSAGDIVSINDLKGKFGCNAVTLGRNGSKIKGTCSDGILNKARESATVIYSGACQGWVTTADANVISGSAVAFQYNVRYLVVAGGGGGGAADGGNGGGSGAGAGGFRTVCSANFSVTSGVAIPITVGGGGTAGTAGSAYPTPVPSYTQGTAGSNSIFSTITSAGGGHGSFAKCCSGGNGGDGGSGGGASGGPSSTGGSGNTPPVSPPQGNDGGDGGGAARGSGGGGAAAAGQDGDVPSNTAVGGAGSPTSILGSIPQAPSFGEPGPAPGRFFAGGGGGGLYSGSPQAPVTNNGGVGGGGEGGTPGCGSAGSTNMGGGGGGAGRGPGPAGPTSPKNGAAGGSGIVILRHATADGTPGTSGGNTVATCGSDTIRIFTADGTFTP
tara:strand:- start:66 stop:1448 length:1383 start_codon:yes stop_codon:yes gene_type:complete